MLRVRVFGDDPLAHGAFAHDERADGSGFEQGGDVVLWELEDDAVLVLAGKGEDLVVDDERGVAELPA